MEKKDFRIVFMGTPDFAVSILEGLVSANFNIVSVVTAPDKPAGRGQQLSESAVKKAAITHSISVLQPSNLKDDVFIHELQSLSADLFVVVAFRMLPEIVWSMPPKGTINLHASLLPNYRGAAPINWAVINGEKETGVTTFFIEKEIDTGKVIEQEKIAIEEKETVGEVHDKLMVLGTKLTVSTVGKIMIGEANGIEQDSMTTATLKNAPKIFKPDCKVDWDQEVTVVHNFIRGLSPYPTAWTELKNKVTGEVKSFKLFISSKTMQSVKDGTALLTSSEGVLFPCADFYLCLTEFQMEGKRRMNYKEFLAGNRLEDWVIE
jgi:methionyl-tRNA formyltransferase